MIKMKINYKFLTFIFVLLLLLILLLVGFVYFGYFRKKTETSVNKTKALEDYKRILNESNVAKQRTAFFNFYGVISNEADKQVLFTMGENSITLEDPEALETIAR